jgi:transcriptional regulator with XRE-family HTH domain
MDSASTLRAARRRAGLTQGALATRAGTSQATVSAYESGRKQPSVATLDRLLAATGTRLSVEPLERPVVAVGDAQLQRAGRGLVEVLALAEALPTRHERRLRFPRLTVRRARPA